MRILFLTHYYPPELGAAPARIAALAHGLARRGADVTVHTGFPHYPSGTVTPPYRNRLLLSEREGAVRVLRSLVYPAPNRGFARRLADHSAFAASALATAAASGPVDVVVAESPPLFTAAAGVAYAIGKRAALALNISDLWPESAIELEALSEGGLPAQAANALARRCYRRAALITAPTAGIVATLNACPEGVGKAVQVPPAVDLERFARIPACAPRADAPLRVLYAGTLGLAQGLPTLVQAAALAGPDVVEVLIAGSGGEEQRLRASIAAHSRASVRLLGSVAPEGIPALYASADAGVVPLRGLPIFAGALPTKLFEVLAAGRPAIVAARGEAARLVSDAEAGVVVDPENPRALADAFIHLRNSPAEAARMGAHAALAARRFDRSAVVEQWHTLIEGLLASRR